MSGSGEEAGTGAWGWRLQSPRERTLPGYCSLQPRDGALDHAKEPAMACWQMGCAEL